MSQDKPAPKPVLSRFAIFAATAVSVVWAVIQVPPGELRSSAAQWAQELGLPRLAAWIDAHSPAPWIFLFVGVAICYWALRSGDPERIAKFARTVWHNLTREIEYVSAEAGARADRVVIFGRTKIDEDTKRWREQIRASLKGSSQPSATVKLPEAEVMLRIKAVDDMHAVLNEHGATVCASVQETASSIRDLPFRHGARDTQHGLRITRGLIKDLIRAIEGVRVRHSLLDSVYPRSLFEFEFRDRMWKALDEISGDIGQIEQIESKIGHDATHKIIRYLMLLAEPHVLPFQKAANVLEEWLKQEKAALAKVRIELLKMLP